MFGLAFISFPFFMKLKNLPCDFILITNLMAKEHIFVIFELRNRVLYFYCS